MSMLTLLWLLEILRHIFFGGNCLVASIYFIFLVYFFMIIHFFFAPNWITSTESISSSLLIFTWCSCPSAMFLKLMLKTSGSWWLSSLYLICKLPAAIKKAKGVAHYIHNKQHRSYTASQGYFKGKTNAWFV